jgi:hypothetical protein
VNQCICPHGELSCSVEWMSTVGRPTSPTEECWQPRPPVYYRRISRQRSTEYWPTEQRTMGVWTWCPGSEPSVICWDGYSMLFMSWRVHVQSQICFTKSNTYFPAKADTIMHQRLVATLPIGSQSKYLFVIETIPMTLIHWRLMKHFAPGTWYRRCEWLVLRSRAL